MDTMRFFMGFLACWNVPPPEKQDKECTVQLLRCYQIGNQILFLIRMLFTIISSSFQIFILVSAYLELTDAILNTLQKLQPIIYYCSPVILFFTLVSSFVIQKSQKKLKDLKHT